MPKPGQKTITMTGESLETLQKIYISEKTKRPNLSFASFISESALIELERRNILKEAMLISLVAFTDDSVIVKDAQKRDKLFEVQFRNKKPRCLEDKKTDCIHVGFALALPEVRKSLNRYQ